ncbi:MAG TPA: hypothetical protein VFW64_18890 [Pseudonocardiaceae bacterium]|nr:hypothetical protein [Pseudonocardiaceae bacterium]
MSPWACVPLAGAVAAGGAVVGVTPWVLDPPEQAATTPIATEAPTNPTR